MIVFVTSCGRPDLLEQTLYSFALNNPTENMRVIIHEDAIDIPFCRESETIKFPTITIVHTNGIGQHASIEKFLQEAPDEKYFVHLEDDWEFDNSYDWISASIAIMEENSDVIKVLCRKDTPHPCEHNKLTFETPNLFHQWGYLEPWENKGIVWNGFSFNPGVTRLDILRKYSFPRWEQELAEMLSQNNWHTAELKRKIYTHIGQNRSTHE